jgi:TonB family protein
MREAVTDVLLERSRTAEGLSRMVLYSMAAHIALLATLALLPRNWLGTSVAPETTAMTISLNGAPGPDSGGRTQLANRAVQAVAPETKLPFVPAPAPKQPEMVVPEPAKPAAKPPDVKKPAEKPSSRKPTTGPEVRSGAARVETGGAAVPFGGLSSAGGGGLNAESFGLENFCCPEYLQTMQQKIRAQWNQNQGAAGRVVVRFVIRRDGMITNVEVIKPSNNVLLDLESRRAVLMTRQLPPLPAAYTEPNLAIRLTFEYQR